MIKREKFIFYRSFYDAINPLGDKTRLSLYEAILNYALNGVEPVFKGIKNTIFTLVKSQLNASIKQSKNCRERVLVRINKSALAIKSNDMIKKYLIILEKNIEEVKEELIQNGKTLLKNTKIGRRFY